VLLSLNPPFHHSLHASFHLSRRLSSTPRCSKFPRFAQYCGYHCFPFPCPCLHPFVFSPPLVRHRPNPSHSTRRNGLMQSISSVAAFPLFALHHAQEGRTDRYVYIYVYIYKYIYICSRLHGPSLLQESSIFYEVIKKALRSCWGRGNHPYERSCRGRGPYRSVKKLSGT
jgi:hypothetical protein